MNLKEMQEIKDRNYAISLGYDVENFSITSEQMEYEMTHLFNYKSKTKKYIESFF